ncbi:hypothetical protein BDW59DRAFT_174943 [Aspergillus cavernicola]|uniref:Secreted protein n=1 Tax=Aspergillus cavernicola TaxID=176166 RepID=A0ABR4HUA5_9EURO
MKFSTVLGFLAILHPLSEWEIEVFPNTTILVRGTIEEARRQALEINPNWDEDFPEEVDDLEVDELDELDKLDVSRFSKRVDRASFDTKKVECGGWKRVNWMQAQTQMIYLRKAGGRPHRGAGPGNCERVSCAYGAAIWWCNNANKPVVLNNFKQIADGAMVVLTSCMTDKFGSGNLVSGRAYHKDRWWVTVRDADC